MVLASLNERVLFYNWTLSGEMDFKLKKHKPIVFSYGKMLQYLLRQLRFVYLLFIIKFLQDSTNTVVLRP